LLPIEFGLDRRTDGRVGVGQALVQYAVGDHRSAVELNDHACPIQ
jgi:hypothetical protein